MRKLLCTAPASIAVAPASVLEATAVAAVAVAACDACAASIGYVPSELLTATVGPLRQLRAELNAFENSRQTTSSGVYWPPINHPKTCLNPCVWSHNAPAFTATAAVSSYNHAGW